MVAYQIAFVQIFTNAPDQAALTLRGALAELPEDLHEERMLLEALSLTLCWFGVSDTRELERLAAYRHDPPEGGRGAKFVTAITAFDWMLRNGPRDACADLALGAIADGTLVEVDSGISPVATASILTFAERPEIGGLWDGWLEEAHRRGSAHGVLTVHVWRAVTLMAHGELVDAERSIEAGLEGHRLWGATVRAGTAQAWGVLTSTLIEQGRLAEARVALEQEAREPVLTYGGIFWRRPKAEMLLAERDFEAAAAAADDLVVEWVTNPALVPWRTIKAQALAALGRADEAVTLATEELALAREWGAPGSIGRALRVLGTVRGDAGLEDLRAAVEVLEPSTARLERAKALFALGVAVRRARQPTESREPLRRALELATACGATALAEDCRGELAASGARPRNTALGGVESLTASERRVTALAAEGRTNRDIAQELYVTPKTVEVHLSNAYRKLGIRSRRELADARAAGPS
jgi:DNA-binding CsgD family transcriptional regulator